MCCSLISIFIKEQPNTGYGNNLTILQTGKYLLISKYIKLPVELHVSSFFYPKSQLPPELYNLEFGDGLEKYEIFPNCFYVKVRLVCFLAKM